ncbi:tRNA threonylcarbamoyl adenosine modification protein, Sua5/YciO/YrdC/YwlC family [Longilinea arvoryzae]|uniref:L-threonylcarbamoyladenylate synthase n=1 Tax=Longilinea arvoryzae TaxID=360412 RepID=A0A0S7BBY2_9CHLR|nr:L-threonylcarbamoyladenylate synthase [Longilinea arvoryzae]GAP15214.1 tRNA threonylcarbamoyl adenosine modification protein, Sua5/YciO/YrdC/YwlC family [Longilinea arvoryzae]
MNSKILSVDDPKSLPRALEILQAGGVIAFPTDTVYGLGCRVDLSQSIDRIYQIKERDQAKAIPVLIGDVAHLARVSAGLGDTARKLAACFWPGALTLVVPRNPGLPANLSQLPTIGVRMPDHSFALTLLRSAGPLATTSANLSGLPSPVTAQDVLNQLEDRLDLIIDGGPCPGGVPSTVVDCTGVDPRILREGAITHELLAQALGRDF